MQAPVLQLISNDDRIFSKEGAPFDEAALVSSDDVTFLDYDGIGHAPEAHAATGPKVTEDVVRWLANRPSVMPSC